MDSPTAPKPPDPTKTSNAQWGYTQNTLNYLSGLNSPNIYSPFGSVTYDHNPNGSVSGQHVSLDPEQQRLLNSQRGFSNDVMGQARGMLGQLPQGQFNLDQVGVPRPGSQDYSAWGDKIAQGSFDKARWLLDPVFAQQNRGLQQSLADRGQPTTGEAYGTETGNMRDAQNRAYGDAANNALLTSGNEMSRLSGIQNQDFNTNLGAKLTERGLPQQELNGLLGLIQQQPYQQQQQTPALNAAPPDFMGAQNTQYQGLLNNYNQQMAQNNAIYGAIGSLAGDAGKAFAMSSRDYKTPGVALAPVLDKIVALPVERWRYRPEIGQGNDERIGTYAEDFRDAFRVGDGKTINIGDAIGVMMKAIQELAAEVRALKAA